MKNILVPTDFSKNADNALKYAVAFAKKEKAKIVLVHGYDMSGVITYSYTPTYIIARTIKANELSSEVKLRAMCSIIKKSGVECEYMNSFGSGTTVILSAINKIKPDFVIMGTKGASGIKEVFMGSQTASVIGKSKYPVIAVPEKAVFKGINTISYATNYNKSDINTIKKVVDIATHFRSKITIVHIAEGNKRDEEKLFFENFKRKIARKITYEKIINKLIFAEDIMGGIEKHTRKSPPDILVMSTKHKNLILRVFGKNITKKIAFHTKVPLLVFNNK